MVTLSQDFIKFVRPADHSTYSPSAAEQWFNCPARNRLTQGIPNEESVYSREGTLAHSACEALFRQEVYMIPFPAELQIELAQQPDGGAEIMHCAHQYVDLLRAWLGNQEYIGQVIYFGLESGVPIIPEKGCFGTGDCIIVGTKGAAVIDYKHGKGKNVAAGSLQLKLYAAGLARYLKAPGDYPIHAVVFQPRTDVAPKIATYTHGELFPTFLNEVWNVIQKQEDPNAQPCQGNHCFWCPAKRVKDPKMKCPLILEAPIKAAEENFNQFLADMSAPVATLADANPKRDAAMVKILSLLPMLEAIANDAKEEFAERIAAGESIPGIYLKDVVGNREFPTKDPQEIERLVQSKYPGVKVLKTETITKARTIGDLEKELGKGKLDTICQRKVKREVAIMDDKLRDILGGMTAYIENQ
jgi:hypothetical protein